jgi:hypothetical protein
MKLSSFAEISLPLVLVVQLFWSCCTAAMSGMYSSWEIIASRNL